MIALLACALTLQQDNAVFIPATDRRVVKIGRWIENKDGSVTSEWPASQIQFKIQGNGFRYAVGGDLKVFWEAQINGVEKTIQGNATASGNLPQAKTLDIRLTRRSEAFAGPGTFKGFWLVRGAKALSVKRSNRRIEIIGDSISAGFGVDGKTKEEAYNYSTANAFMTYGPITARALDAECTDIAWSGKKMWPDNTIPEIYDYILPNSKQGTWKPTKGLEPQVVVINLATNDFGKGVPNEEGWTKGYGDFVRKIRKNYPSAWIYLATGSMMTDTWPPKELHLSTLKRYLAKIQTDLKDAKVGRVDFEPQNEARDGIGSSWHPNANTQKRMASVLTAQIQKDLKW